VRVSIRDVFNSGSIILEKFCAERFIVPLCVARGGTFISTVPVSMTMGRKKVAKSSAYDRITAAQGAQIRQSYSFRWFSPPFGLEQSHQEHFIANRMVHLWHMKRHIVFSTTFQ